MSLKPSSLRAFVFATGLLAACGSGPTTPATGPSTTSVSMAASSFPAPELSPTATAPIVVPPASSGAAGEAPHHDPAQLDPSLATAKAPDMFRAAFTTTRGTFVIEVHRDWAPNGADRFYNLVKLGFFDDTRFFRVIDGFMVQFGISGDPRVAGKWRSANIKDDPVVKSNKRGMVTFAQTSQNDSRSTQIFINFADNGQLDASRFAPFGEVVQGMSVVDSLYHGYGEGRPNGNGPDQGRVQESGNQYLDSEFPLLDHIVSAKLL